MKYITIIIVWDIQLFKILLVKFLVLELFQKLLPQMVFIMFLLMSGFAHCGENFMLSLEKREFIYEFNNKIIQSSSQINLIDFSVEDW